jgi:hypothetical protein
MSIPANLQFPSEDRCLEASLRLDRSKRPIKHPSIWSELSHRPRLLRSRYWIVHEIMNALFNVNKVRAEADLE